MNRLVISVLILIVILASGPSVTSQKDSVYTKIPGDQLGMLVGGGSTLFTIGGLGIAFRTAFAYENNTSLSDVMAVSTAMAVPASFLGAIVGRLASKRHSNTDHPFSISVGWAAFDPPHNTELLGRQHGVCVGLGFPSAGSFQYLVSFQHFFSDQIDLSDFGEPVVITLSHSEITMNLHWVIPLYSFEIRPFIGSSLFIIDEKGTDSFGIEYNYQFSDFGVNLGLQLAWKVFKHTAIHGSIRGIGQENDFLTAVSCGIRYTFDSH